MITELKVGDKVKVGELVLKCIKGADYEDYYNLKEDEYEYTQYFKLRHLNAMGAVLVKEPRKMTVWEWRKFQGVVFTTLQLADDKGKRLRSPYTLMWENDQLLYKHLDNWEFMPSVVASFLESIGTEVLDA